MRIEVTEEDIKFGTRYMPNRCPLATAISRALGSTDISVGLYVVMVRNSTPMRAAIALPESACWFRAQFDAKEPVQPITFELPI